MRGETSFETLQRILRNNPHDRAMRIDRAVIEGVLLEMVAVAQLNKLLTSRLAPTQEVK